MDHYSLKLLLVQRLSMVPQHQWISKLFGFDFTVEYRPGRLNTVADALSLRDADHDAAVNDSDGRRSASAWGPPLRSSTTFAGPPRLPRTLNYCGSNWRRASWTSRGAWQMACSCMDAVSSCRTTTTSVTRC